MIKVFYGETPNVYKVTIAIEEMGLESERVPVNIFEGEQFSPAFLAISPNNRIPAIVDTAPTGGGEPISVAESGAILIYLAEKVGRFLPSTPKERALTLQWVMWQMSAQGPTLGQFGHFRNYAPEKLPYAIERFGKESHRLYGLLDRQLSDREYLAGDYSIADMICWPWLLFREHHGLDLAEFPNLGRWFHSIDARPAVREALRESVIPKPRTSFSDEERQLLFNQRGV
ncbi:MAG: glutathione S-transferase N-terminal domain-containing protein [Porticoccaceae bacterium]|nr:glutathione S-transferase N-terminal domain-containing protein [Porticoccaceae bacterium]